MTRDFNLEQCFPAQVLEQPAFCPAFAHVPARTALIDLYPPYSMTTSAL